MSKRNDFLHGLWRLLKFAEDMGYELAPSWLLRDIKTQRRMFEEGLSKCDGINITSDHQNALAIDLYIMENGKISEDHSKYLCLHKYAEIFGFKPMLEWDMGHFGWGQKLKK